MRVHRALSTSTAFDAVVPLRESERRAGRLEVELTALREREGRRLRPRQFANSSGVIPCRCSVGMTAWGDGVSAQREHMSALRDEIMELRTMLGRGVAPEAATDQSIAGQTVMSLQELQRLCESCAPGQNADIRSISPGSVHRRQSSQLQANEKKVAALQSERTRLKEGVIETREAGAIDHYTPLLAMRETEAADLKAQIEALGGKLDPMLAPTEESAQ